jgi:hypothetical protein
MRYSRGTVSVLWFNTSGRASRTVWSAASLPWKSGISTSIRQSDSLARVSRIVSEIDAPPSGGRRDRLSDHDAIEVERLDGVRRLDWFGRIDRPGRPCATAHEHARADAEDHERRGAVI